MKQKAVLILLLFILSGCGAADASVSTVTVDTTNIVSAVTGSVTFAETAEDTYVLNTDTKKIHESDCLPWI